eukprot:969712-Prymnesium_polylepis.1
MARAKRNVGKMADPSAEHARLACAVGGVVTAPKRPVAAPPAAVATDSQKLPASGGAGDSEALKRIEKATSPPS